MIGNVRLVHFKYFDNEKICVSVKSHVIASYYIKLFVSWSKDLRLNARMVGFIPTFTNMLLLGASHFSITLLFLVVTSEVTFDKLQ